MYAIYQPQMSVVSSTSTKKILSLLCMSSRHLLRKLLVCRMNDSHRKDESNLCFCLEFKSFPLLNLVVVGIFSLLMQYEGLFVTLVYLKLFCRCNIFPETRSIAENLFLFLGLGALQINNLKRIKTVPVDVFSLI